MARNHRLLKQKPITRVMQSTRAVIVDQARSTSTQAPTQIVSTYFQIYK